MNSLVRSYLLLALLAILGLSCTTNNTTISGPVLAPTITRFSPDTVWTLQYFKIYGTNFGYDSPLVTIDTARAHVYEADDTVMTVLVPENARTGLIHVRTYEQTATFTKPVTILQTFNPRTPFLDSLPAGGQFSIPGSGMNNYHGRLHISLNSVPLAIDSVFPDRIVSHIAINSYSGTLVVSDDSASYQVGTIYVTRPSPWHTLSQIWDRVQFTAYHRRTGYINGLPIDSLWQDTVTYDHQIDLNIAGKLFTKTSRGVSYSISSSSFTYPTILHIDWDSVSQYAGISFQKYAFSQVSQSNKVDTLWEVNYVTLPVSRPVGADIEFMLQNLSGVIHRTIDSTGSVSLLETTSLQFISGSFDLILKR